MSENNQTSRNATSKEVLFLINELILIEKKLTKASVLNARELVSQYASINSAILILLCKKVFSEG